MCGWVSVWEKGALSNRMIHRIYLLLWRVFPGSLAHVLSSQGLSLDLSVCTVDSTGCPSTKTHVSSAVWLVSSCVDYSAGANNVCDRWFVYGVVPGHGQSAAKHTGTHSHTQHSSLSYNWPIHTVHTQCWWTLHHNAWLSISSEVKLSNRVPWSVTAFGFKPEMGMA